jgi:DeoR/GlpR family transcriptional regulator of sugar metabolism
MQNSTTSVLLVDHAKFGRPATHRLCELTDFDLVITDQGVDDEDADDLRTAGVNLQIADPLES